MKRHIPFFLVLGLIITGFSYNAWCCATHITHAQEDPPRWKNEIYVPLKTEAPLKTLIYDTAFTGA